MEESNTEIKNNYNNNEGTDLNSQVTTTPDLVVQQSLNKLQEIKTQANQEKDPLAPYSPPKKKSEEKEKEKKKK